MKKTLFSKIFFGYLIIMTALVAAIILFAQDAIRSFHVDALADSLQKLTKALEPSLLSFYTEDRTNQLNDFITNIGASLNVRLTIIAPDGTVIADSLNEPALMENHGNRPEVADALSSGAGRSLRYSSTVQEGMLYVASPLVAADGHVMSVVRVSLFVSDIDSFLMRIRRRIGIIAVLVMLAALGFSLLLSRKISEPLRELSAASRKVSSGDFTVRVYRQINDEFKEISDSFNRMTEQIQTLFDRVSQQKYELASIISSLQEGLLVIDKNGIIVLANESLQRITAHERMQGRPYWEVVRDSSFEEQIKSVFRHKEHLTVELDYHGRIFLASAAFIAQTKGVVVVLHDITDSKNIERIKRDFVANASHELRTPLTAIKGFVETIQDDSSLSAEARHHLSIILRNADRVINIIRDLLLLSQLEHGEGVLEREPIDLTELLDDVKKIFAQSIAEKDLSLVISAAEQLPPFQGDRFKLEQLFINLIDNAIKYTEKGSVEITVKADDAVILIEVKDTGIGIPEQHLNRIFERFYVVDKSRSKKVGGTGLGLSIVKHIVLLHKGDIQVSSTPNAGTIFSIILPHRSS